ncbi:hypothetical protein GCM10025783_27550 [Amnibacterium soli]|uniref:BioF2-like acetyltransferase domain-containing protein n=1 Tax=Amnibacterium soli TaxID=1282736 RepID=A0ABP8ZD18_9MICO
MKQHAAPRGLDELSEREWTDFALDVGSIFATREWFATWLLHEPGLGPVEVLVSRRGDGSVAGVLALAVERSVPRVLGPLGPWPAAAPSIVCKEEDRGWITEDLVRQVQARRGVDMLRLVVPASQAPQFDAWRGDRGVAISDRSIQYDGRTWDELLSASGRNSRRAFLRRSRRLRESFAVGFRRTERADQLENDVDLLLQLHWKRWGDEVLILTPERRALLQSLAAATFARNRLYLRFLELDGRAAAAQLSFRVGTTEFAFMSAADPELREHQVGIEMLFHTVEASIADGMSALRLLPGDQEYKQRLPSIDHPIQPMLVPMSALGTAVLGGRRVARRIQRSVQRDTGSESPSARE